MEPACTSLCRECRLVVNVQRDKFMSHLAEKQSLRQQVPKISSKRSRRPLDILAQPVKILTVFFMNPVQGIRTCNTGYSECPMQRGVSSRLRKRVMRWEKRRNHLVCKILSRNPHISSQDALKEANRRLASSRP